MAVELESEHGYEGIFSTLPHQIVLFTHRGLYRASYHTYTNTSAPTAQAYSPQSHQSHP